MQTVDKCSLAVLGALVALLAGCAGGEPSPSATRVAAEQVPFGDPGSIPASAPLGATATAAPRVEPPPAPTAHSDVQASKPRVGGSTSTSTTTSQLAPAPAPPSTTTTRTYTYTVASNGPVHSDLAEFSGVVASTLGDPRGWADGGRRTFRQVAQGGDFTVVLATPEQVHAYSPAGCDTVYSCTAGNNVIINEARWIGGPATYP